jgi:hypothetical protein
MTGRASLSGPARLPFLLVLRLALALTLLLSVPAASAATDAGRALPERGVLLPGKSLGGVELGQTAAQVRARWSTRYRGRATTGAAVSFRGGRVTTVFTLGVPRGWRTDRGVALGDPADKVHAVYGALPWSRCIGYGAVSIRRAGVVASIYTYGDSVYGFALTLPSEPVCQ